MANNPTDKVFLDDTKLSTIAGGGTITSGSDTFTADENSVYFIKDTSAQFHNVELLESKTLTAASTQIDFAEYNGRRYFIIQVSNSATLSTGTVTIRIDYRDNTYDTLEYSVSSSQKRFMYEITDLGPLKKVEAAAGVYMGLIGGASRLPRFIEKTSEIKKLKLTCANTDGFPVGLEVKLYGGVID